MSTYFDAFAEAVEDYPSTDMTLSIIDVTVLAPGTGPEINENEVASFKVRVNNDGHLKVTNLTLHIQGLNGAKVSENAAGPWEDNIYPGNMTLSNHSSLDTADFFFKAPSNDSNGSVISLVKAHISEWDGSITSIMQGHSRHADPPSGTYSTEVFP